MKSVNFLVTLAIVFAMVSSGFAFMGLLNRVQKNWMESWERMRDQQIRPRLVAKMNLRGRPTFVQTVDSDRGKVDLAVNFLNTSNDEISLLRIKDIGNWLKTGGTPDLEEIGQGIGWMNSVGKVEDYMIPDSDLTYWWAATHFYQGVDGQIVLIPVTKGNQTTALPPVIITPLGRNIKKWYYSMIEWFDMNQDGWPDLVTTRSRGVPGSINYSELVWFENPGYRYIWDTRRSWRYHQITHGPDVGFRILRIPLPSGKSRLVVIGAGYWDNKLYAVWTDDPEENWTNVDAINERVIDNHGWFFDLQIADINADGRDDVMVSTWHARNEGSVFVYEIPCDFIRDKWRRHTLISEGMATLPDLGSGGKINVFHPLVRHAQLSRKKKPFIIVSGDDDGRVYVLIPNSRKTDDWSYSSHTIYKTRGPVGALAIDDLNHDGYMEIVVPVVDSNKLLYFTYEPSEIGPSYFVDETRNGPPIQ